MSVEIQFIEQILSNLKNHGYPEKRVSLPLEKMYEVADNKGLNFNSVLKKLKEDHKTDHSIETEKVIFFPLRETPFSLNPDELKNMNPDDLKKQAEEMMKTMGPEQMAEIQKAFANMSPEEKEEIMRKGKEMGLV